MRIVVNPTYEYLRPFIETIPAVFESSGESIHQGRNVLKRYQTRLYSVIVKSFKVPHVLNRFIYASVRKSKAFRSYMYAVKLLERDIQTPAPIAYIEEYKCGLLRSYYISEEIKKVREMRDFWENPVIGDRLPVLISFGRFTAQMHRKQVLHRDYSAGNILYGEKDGEIFFSLVDINRIRFDHPVGEEEGYKNFERLWLSDECFDIIARSYAESMGYDVNHAVERVMHYKNKLMNK